MDGAEKLKALFPIKVKITKEIIEEGRKSLWDTSRCIGALTLKSVLPEEFKDRATWGVYTGGVSYSKIRVTTEEGIDIMEVKKPRTVNLILSNYE
jgi:hypothetical protein